MSTKIECSCTICRNNNTANPGNPLSAVVPDTMPQKLLKSASGRHGLVYSANDPSIIGDAVRAATGLQKG